MRPSNPTVPTTVTCVYGGVRKSQLKLVTSFMDDLKAFFFEFNSNKSCSGSYIQYFHKFSSNFIREKRFQFVCQLNFSVGGASQVNDIIIILFQKSRILNIVSIILQVFWRNSYGILPTWKNRWLRNSFGIHWALHSAPTEGVMHLFDQNWWFWPR